MEIIKLSIALFVLILLVFILWKLADTDDKVKRLQNEVDYFKLLREQEKDKPEQPVIIDYENLKQEL